MEKVIIILNCMKYFLKYEKDFNRSIQVNKLKKMNIWQK